MKLNINSEEEGLFFKNGDTIRIVFNPSTKNLGFLNATTQKAKILIAPRKK